MLDETTHRYRCHDDEGLSMTAAAVLLWLICQGRDEQMMWVFILVYFNAITKYGYSQLDVY